jgi:hypothetical protein
LISRATYRRPATGFQIGDRGFQERSFAVTRRNLLWRIFSGLDGAFDPCEDGASDSSPVSAAALINSDAEVRSADRPVLAFAFAGLNELEGHGLDQTVKIDRLGATATRYNGRP